MCIRDRCTTNAFERVLNARPVEWLGEISYEVFLLHVIMMEIVMASVLHWPVFSGSWPTVFAVTLIMTIPPAWLLHRWTRPRCDSPRAKVSTLEAV